MDFIVARLQKMCETCQPLSISIVQPIFGITLENLCERLGDFLVIREWACQFVKHYMNWLFWKGTNVASKIPTNWCEKECNMCHQIPYLMKFTNSLLIGNNSDKTRVHVVPTVGERTWEIKSKKHVKILGMDDKRQTIVVSSTTNGLLLPFQIVLHATHFIFSHHQMIEERNALLMGLMSPFLQIISLHWKHPNILLPHLHLQTKKHQDGLINWLLECW